MSARYAIGLCCAAHVFRGCRAGLYLSSSKSDVPPRNPLYQACAQPARVQSHHRASGRAGKEQEGAPGSARVRRQPDAPHVFEMQPPDAPRPPQISAQDRVKERYERSERPTWRNMLPRSATCCNAVRHGAIHRRIDRRPPDPRCRPTHKSRRIYGGRPNIKSSVRLAIRKPSKK